MNFKKKLKNRLYFAIGYIIIGLAMVAAGFVLKTENTFLPSFGLVIAVCGLARIRKYFYITRSEECIRKQEIAETDERNIAISNRAKTAAFSVYITIICIAVIALMFFNMAELAQLLSGSVCLLVFIYWVSYFIIRKKF